MTGGGFGGCAILLVDSGQQAVIESTILAEYRKVTGIEPTVFACRPSRGCHEIAINR
jgi:galactokinase